MYLHYKQLILNFPEHLHDLQNAYIYDKLTSLNRVEAYSAMQMPLVAERIEVRTNDPKLLHDAAPPCFLSS